MRPPSHFMEALNEGQRAAVEAPDGPVLVIAAAGTGKTRTLTCRVAHLVQRGVPAGRILLLTFTNRAAREMLDRARALAGPEVAGLWGGTFHHMANRILRRHAACLGFGSDYSILDQDDAERLVRVCSRELNLTGRHFPKPAVLLDLCGLAASTGRLVGDVAAARFQGKDPPIDQIELVCSRYAARKRELNSMDFDDLLAHALQLLVEHPEIRASYQERFLHVLVDEYQDTNRIQADWVDLLAGARRNLLVVGDDFQSIYSWRGADFRNILSFPERYPDTRVFKLEINYRSVPEVLEVANACIAGNPDQYQKELRAVRGPGGRPVLVRPPDGRSQAWYIIDQVRALQAEGFRPPEIAVLYRSHFHALDLQLELARSRVPFVITSGLRFFEQAHVKDVCALLRLAANPADELAFTRLLGLFPRVGERTAQRLWTVLGRRFDAAHPSVRKTLADHLPKAAREDAQRVLDLLAEALGGEEKPRPADLVEAFVEAFYDTYARETFENYERRAEDLGELAVFAATYDRLEAFLAETALLTNLDTSGEDEASAGRETESLRLSTIHQAKGLEWKAVFVLWVAEGLFPSARSLAELQDVSEERRLFYVAVTRARDRLFLSAPRSRRMKDGGTMPCLPSRFIRELPAGLLDRQQSFA